MAFEQTIERRALGLDSDGRTPRRNGARSNPGKPRPGLSPGLTRILDVFIAGLALAFLAPLMVIVALICRLSDPGPVFYGQLRCGRGGRMFRCLKFRSMVVDADRRLEDLLNADPAARAEWAATHKLINDPRITPIGRFLRKSSLDELPQLINVLRGDMSLVGPRPIVPGEIIHYGRYIAHYNQVLPGITGMWQVSGRSETNYRRRVALDLLFIRRRSLYLYLRILLLTVPAVLLRRGAY